MTKFGRCDSTTIVMTSVHRGVRSCLFVDGLNSGELLLDTQAVLPPCWVWVSGYAGSSQGLFKQTVQVLIILGIVI